MELFLIFGLITILSVGLGGVVIIVGLLMGWDYLNQEKKLRSAWEEFALLHDLTVMTFGMFPGTEVTGTYRGYRLRLENSRKPQYRSSLPSTRLTIVLNDTLLGNGGSRIDPFSLDEALIKLQENAFDRRGELMVIPYGPRMVYEQLGTEIDPARLQLLFDSLIDLAEAYPRLVTVGGELVPYLEEIWAERVEFRPFVTQLAQTIGRETKARLAAQASQLYCEACVTWCAVHKAYLNWHVTYYGCRTCQQSCDFFYIERVIVVLDRHMADEVRLENDTLRVSWFAQGELFDFDSVEIIAASDEEVERFAVRVGNDTEPWRQPRYRQMRCVVHPSSGLSENTLKILERTFGQFVIQPSE